MNGQIVCLIAFLRLVYWENRNSTYLEIQDGGPMRRTTVMEHSAITIKTIISLHCRLAVLESLGECYGTFSRKYDNHLMLTCSPLL